jgi:hypothetical protein
MCILSIRSDWEAISARIDALVMANHVYLAAFIRKSDDPYAGHNELIEEAIAIFEELKAFQSRYHSTLPHKASESLNRLLERRKNHFTPGHVSSFEGLKVLVPALAATRSAVDYHLRDFSVVARRITERAFIHLQRLIVADSDARQKWQKAFQAGETQCEKLGATHLLSHGIWAFKSNAEGERTDLVMGEPLGDIERVEAVADALVLTEWKVLKKGGDLEEVLQKARRQASLHATGSLAGIELANYRYNILVSKGRVELPPDHKEEGVIYRHVAIATEPETPSRA